MQKFNDSVIVTSGKNLIDSVNAGTDKITYTRAVLSAQDITSLTADQVVALTDVTDQKQSSNIKVVSRNGDTIKIGVQFDNSSVTADYTFNTIAWYAKGSQTVTNEVLLAVTSSNGSQTMPAGSSNQATAAISPTLILGLSHNAQVVLQPDPAGSLTKNDLDAAIAEISQKGLINLGNEIANNQDLHTLYNTAINLINGETLKNAPSDFSGRGYLISTGSNDSTKDTYHELFDTKNNVVYVESYNSSSNAWSTWEKQVNTDQMEASIQNGLNTKVNVSDMRKPANDVAGIEEVSAKQDKIAYTPADDSKVVHDNHDGTEQLNGVQVQPYNKLTDTIGGRNYALNTATPTTINPSVNSWQKLFATNFSENLNGEDVVLSFDLSVQGVTNTSFIYIQTGANTNPAYFTPTNSSFQITGPNYSGWQIPLSKLVQNTPTRFSYKFTMPQWADLTNSNIYNLIFSSTGTLGASVTISKVKVEKGSVATDWTPAPEDKVNVSDMRKPASDVAGIEEVNAKQDKIGYTPADDSKVAHDNHDGTITANGTVFNLLNSLSASSIPQDPTKDYNTLPQGLALMSELNGEPANMPPVKSTYLTLTIASNFATGRKRQLAWLDAGANSSNNNYTYIRYCVGSTWSSWDSIPTSTQISSLIPSTIADTTKLANFTAGLQSGGVSVATSDDLKSVENSAWHQLSMPDCNGMKGITLLYRNFMSDHYMNLYAYGNAIQSNINGPTMLDLSSLIDKIEDISGEVTGLDYNIFLSNLGKNQDRVGLYASGNKTIINRYYSIESSSPVIISGYDSPFAKVNYNNWIGS